MAHNILVTGGSGFIGTHLCRRLVAAGHRVCNLDLLAPTTSTGAQFYQGDVCDSEIVQKLCQGVDAILHLAAIASVPVCEASPLESYRTNLLGTAVVLDAAAKQGRKPRVVFASSAAVYGKSSIATNQEDGAGMSLQSIYAAQKFGSEQMLNLFQVNQSVPCVVFRFFNVYGPGQDPKSQYSGVISLFADAIQKGKNIRLFGDGTQSRDFISVYDIVRAFELALSLPEEKCDSLPINLASGSSITIRELAELMQKLAKKKVEVALAPARAGDILHSGASVERAKRLLGWEAKTTLATGLAELL
jgi:UDP-glucose 4-epimerase